MFRKLTGLVAVAAAVVATALLVPAVALACSGTSAVCIYSPGSVGPGGGHSGGGGGNAGGGAGQNQPPLPVSPHVTGALSQARIPQQDKPALERIAKNPAFGKTRGLSSITPESVVAPSTIGAALDLGPGPIALIAVLAASAVLLLGATGWRGWRRWRRPLA